MTRRKSWHAAAPLACLVVAAPFFALLCRGHAPSRFAESNLPFWQRALPHPARRVVALRCPPAAPGTVQGDASQPQNVNADQLLAALERPSSSRPSDASAGRAGQWLETACAYGRADARLCRQQNDVATRLMNAQDSDGYLAVGKGAARWSPAQAAAFGRNLRGLLAFYAVSRSPSSLYAAMQAGDLVTTEVTARTPDGLLLPLARLYLATGEPRYRAWALGMARVDTTDGPGLCAVYGLTGQTQFLRTAEGLWTRQTARGRPDADLSAALFAVMGAPAYLPTEDAAASPWVCPLSEGTLAYSRLGDGLAVNAAVNSSATFGAVRLTQRVVSQGRERTITVHAPRPTRFTLQVNVPPASSGSAPIRVLVNGKPQAVTPPRGTSWAARRAWQEGDTVTLTRRPARTAGPAGGRPAGG